MPELLTFPKHAVPREIAAQIRSYLRIQWPHLDPRSGKLWNIPPTDATTFVLVQDELLVSHAEIKRKDFTFQGENQKILGLSAVFTYPAWRGAGFGHQIVQAATHHILRDNDADAALLFCAQPRIPLYQSTGWQPMPTTTTLEGNPDHPTVHNNPMMLLPITETGQALRTAFQNAKVYVGPTTW